MNFVWPTSQRQSYIKVVAGGGAVEGGIPDIKT